MSVVNHSTNWSEWLIIPNQSNNDKLHPHLLPPHHHSHNLSFSSVHSPSPPFMSTPLPFLFLHTTYSLKQPPLPHLTAVNNQGYIYLSSFTNLSYFSCTTQGSLHVSSSLTRRSKSIVPPAILSR